MIQSNFDTERQHVMTVDFADAESFDISYTQKPNPTEVGVNEAESEMTVRTKIKLGAEALRSEMPHQIGPDSLGALRLIGDQAILEARQIHAQAFKDYGNVAKECIDPTTGVLVDSIDAPETVKNSDYMGTTDEKGNLTGFARLINSEPGKPATLPSVSKLQHLVDSENAPLDYLNDTRVFEVSLGRAVGAKDMFCATKLILAANCLAVEKGYDHGFLAIVEEVAGLMEAIYGPKAFKRIENEEIVIDGNLVDPNGEAPKDIKLLPYLVDPHTFTSDVLEHLDTQPAGKLNDGNRKLCEETRAFLAPAQ